MGRSLSEAEYQTTYFEKLKQNPDLESWQVQQIMDFTLSMVADHTSIGLSMNYERTNQ